MDKNTIYSNFIHGGISGMIAITATHPIDTAKIYLQNNKPIPRSLKLLYTGLPPPLVGVTIEKFIVFGFYKTIMNNQDNPSYLQIMKAGLLAGLGATTVVTPCERWKILLQTNQRVNIKELGIKGLYQGFTATLLREPPGYAIYFTVYEYLKRNYSDRGNIPKYKAFLFGGMAGIGAWIFIYPGERFKTIMQTSKKQITLRDSFDVLRREGISNLFRGFGPAAFRAGIIHAIVFTFNEIFSSKR